MGGEGGGGGGDGAGEVGGRGGEGGVVVDEGEAERGDVGAEVVVDDIGDGEAEGVGGEGLALVEAVGLVVEAVGGADLDEGGGGEVVIGEEVEAELMVEGVAGGEGVGGEDEVAGEAGSGGVGVLLEVWLSGLATLYRQRPPQQSAAPVKMPMQNPMGLAYTQATAVGALKRWWNLWMRR